MNELQEENLLQTLYAIAASMATIAESLEGIQRSLAPAAPNYKLPIGAFVDFDWASIGAKVAKSDAFGPSQAIWNGQIWTRRSPENKFGEAVWFSRPEGKNEDGSTHYIRLVTFKDFEDAEPVSRKAESALAKAEASPSSGTGQLVSRPYPPKHIKEKIRDHSATTFASEKATREDRFQLNYLLKKLSPNVLAVEADKRGSAILRYLTGCGAELELSDPQVLAVLHWIHADRDAAGARINPDPQSVKEAEGIYKEVTKEK